MTARRFFPSTIRVGNNTSAFISTWRTSNTSTGSSTSTQVKLPLITTGTYNFNVNWGDGNSDNITVWNQAETTHTYGASGDYTITITGTIIGWRFNNTGDRLKILDISQWGNLRFTNTTTQFHGCSNLDITATDQLVLNGLVTGIASFFLNCTSLVYNSSINNADVTGVTSLANFLRGCPNFNQPIDNLFISSITSINQMLSGSSSFNQDLSGADVTGITNASGFMNSVTLSSANYDALLISWAAQSLNSGVTCSFGASKYSPAAATARANIISQGWTITDGGPV